jgi:hypothetical protein
MDQHHRMLSHVAFLKIFVDLKMRACVAVLCIMSLSIVGLKLDDLGYLWKRETGSQRYLSCIMQCRGSEVLKQTYPRKLIKAVRATERRSENEKYDFRRGKNRQGKCHLALRGDMRS